VKGPEEDEAFAKDPYLWTNFRRGNTILELYDPNDINKFVGRTIGRKGLNKFFDLQYRFITKDLRYKEDILD
jgi:hypothetical protein